MADPGAPLDPRITEGVVHANGVDVHYLEAGSGPLALLLHGFPDSAHTWRHLLPALADAGYHAVAPWLRGYAPTSVPPDGRYQVGVLAQDACALHDALGDGSPAALIGHDWGALAGYTAAGAQPERWSSFTALAVPPLGSLLAGFTSYTQLRRSWYMFFFQSPLADGAVAADDLAFIDRLWADWSPGFDAAAELPAVKAALRGPENLTAALGYYRATLGDGYKDPALAEIEGAGFLPVPVRTLYLHGTDDGCMGAELVTDLSDQLPVEGSRVELVSGTGHFLQLEHPATVNRLILDFIG